MRVRNHVSKLPGFSVLRVVAIVVLAFLIPESTGGTYKRNWKLKLSQTWTVLRTAF